MQIRKKWLAGETRANELPLLNVGVKTAEKKLSRMLVGVKGCNPLPWRLERWVKEAHRKNGLGGTGANFGFGEPRWFKRGDKKKLGEEKASKERGGRELFAGGKGRK